MTARTFSFVATLVALVLVGASCEPIEKTSSKSSQKDTQLAAATSDINQKRDCYDRGNARFKEESTGAGILDAHSPEFAYNVELDTCLYYRWLTYKDLSSSYSIIDLYTNTGIVMLRCDDEDKCYGTAVMSDYRLGKDYINSVKTRSDFENQKKRLMGE